MDNSGSYFENKTVVKNKVKRIYNKILRSENFKNLVINDHVKINDKEIVIDLCNKNIQKKKDKAQKITEIYTHG